MISAYDRYGSEMVQREPVARIEALYRNEWPGIAKRRLSATSLCYNL